MLKDMTLGQRDNAENKVSALHAINPSTNPGIISGHASTY